MHLMLRDPSQTLAENNLCEGVEKSDRGSDQGLQSGQQRKGDPQTLDDLPKDRVTKALDNSQQSSMEPPAVVTGNSEVREQEWPPEGPASSTYDEDLEESDLEVGVPYHSVCYVPYLLLTSMPMSAGGLLL